MRDHEIGTVPVVDGRESMLLVGVITDRDIVLRHVAKAHHHDCAVRERPGAGADDVTDIVREEGDEHPRRVRYWRRSRSRWGCRGRCALLMRDRSH